MTAADLVAGARALIEPLNGRNLFEAAPVMRDTIEALLGDRDALMQRIAELEAKPTSPKQQASAPPLSPGREFVLRYLNDKGPSSSWPICKSAMAEGVGYGMEWADKYLRWLRTSGLAARTGRRDSSGRSIHQITNAGRARLKADEDALMQRLEALMSFARPFADALDIECDFMTPPAPFEDGFDVRARARAALQADEAAE